MNKIRRTLIGVAIAALTVVAAPLTAQAAETTPSAPAEVTADGYLHTYYNTNLDGRCLSWQGNSTDWGKCRNQVSSLWNNGYVATNEDVWVYNETGYSGRKRGVYRGTKLHNLNDWKFDGSTYSLNNRIESHKWTNLPG